MDKGPIDAEQLAPTPTGGLMPLTLDADGVMSWAATAGVAVPDHTHSGSTGGGGPAYVVFLGFNNSGSTIPAFSAVRVAGTSGGVPVITLAKADSTTTMPAAGVTSSAILTGASGYVVV